ncbi:MAG: hypothetical protein IJY52_01580 [Anaerotignum sp.]|nr:hypothetical protein [Anaerotignum sp.]
MNGMRIGRISAVNYEAGTVRILYNDKSGEVTKELPLLAHEYFMPEIDDMVFVCHLPNGAEAAVVLGRYWSDKNRPPEGRKGLYRKDFSRTPGKAMIRYDEESGEGTMNMPTVGFSGNRVRLEGVASVTITGAATSVNGSTVEIIGGTVTINGGTIEISGSGDVTLDGISLKNHTHICSTSGSESSAPK